MKHVNILYALEFDGSLLGFSVRANGDDAEFCNSTSVELEEYGDNIWTTHDRAVAERVVKKSTMWYSSSLDCPEYPEKMKGKLKVVEFYRRVDTEAK